MWEYCTTLPHGTVRVRNTVSFVLLLALTKINPRAKNENSHLSRLPATTPLFLLLTHHPSRMQNLNSISIFPFDSDPNRRKITMKYSFRLIQFLILLVCVINAANAFVARETRQLAVQRHLQRENRALFQEQPAFEKEALKTEEAAVEKAEELEDEMSDTQKLMKQVKEAGTAGVISYALWELGFWALSVRFNSFSKLNLKEHKFTTALLQGCKNSIEVKTI